LCKLTSYTSHTVKNFWVFTVFAAGNDINQHKKLASSPRNWWFDFGSGVFFSIFWTIKFFLDNSISLLNHAFCMWHKVHCKFIILFYVHFECEQCPEGGLVFWNHHPHLCASLVKINCISQPFLLKFMSPPCVYWLGTRLGWERIEFIVRTSCQFRTIYWSNFSKDRHYGNIKNHMLK
jgi:hypothetical protein